MSDDFNVDALVQAALSPEEPANNQGAPQVQPTPGKPAKGPQQPERTIREEQQQAGDDPEPEETPAEEPEEPEAAEEEAEPEYGTKDRPYTRKDMTGDQFIELKVDGEKVVVSFAELADGYGREKVFRQRMGKVDQLTKEAETAIERSRAEPARIRESINALFNDPDRLHAFMVENWEGTLHRLAQIRAKHIDTWSKDPKSRVAFEAELARKRIQLERDRFEAERQATIATDAEKTEIQHWKRIIEPGLQKGLKELGYPQIDPDMKQLVGALLKQFHEGNPGKEASSEDISRFVVQAGKALGRGPSSAAAPRPLQLNRAPRAANTPRRPNGQFKPGQAPANFRESFSDDALVRNLRGR